MLVPTGGAIARRMRAEIADHVASHELSLVADVASDGRRRSPSMAQVVDLPVGAILCREPWLAKLATQGRSHGRSFDAQTSAPAGPAQTLTGIQAGLLHAIGVPASAGTPSKKSTAPLSSEYSAPTISS